MNRLVLIGNGFDLAHGLKTSVVDFLNYRLINFLKKEKEEPGYQDSFFAKREYNRATSGIHMQTLSSLYNSIVNNHVEGRYFKRIIAGEVELNSRFIKEFTKWVSKLKLKVGLAYKNSFFEHIFKLQSDQNVQWFDVKEEYFNLLHRVYTSDHRGNNTKKEEKIRTLNDDFSVFRNEFISYLKSQATTDNLEPYNDLLNILPAKTIKGKIKSPIHKTHFLNFNYTKTLLPYLEILYSESLKIEHNQIHGAIDSEVEPIFGFGDEHNKKYKPFEEETNDDLLTHMKSYHYLLHSNYRNLINFLESDKFEVAIFGHSCGLSDRTLLKEIFEHENCDKIYNFYHREDAFRATMFNISRQFENKALFRKRMVDLSSSTSMPQPS